MEACKTSSIVREFVYMGAKAQLVTVVAMAFDIKPQLESNPKFKAAPYARDVARETEYVLSEKSLENCASVARAVITRYGDKMGSYALQAFTVADVQLFANFLSNQAAHGGYTLSLDDIGYLCRGEMSSKARKQAALQAALEEERKKAEAALAQKEQDLQAALQRELDKQAAPAEQAAEEQAAPAAPVTAPAAEETAEVQRMQERVDAAQSQLATLREEAAQAEQEQAAQAAQAKQEQAAREEQARKQRESIAIEVHVSKDGQPIICMQPNQSPQFLREVAAYLLKQAAETDAVQVAMLQASMETSAATVSELAAEILADLPAAPVQPQAKRRGKKVALDNLKEELQAA